MGKFDIDLNDEMNGGDAPRAKKGAPALVWVFVVISLALAGGLALLGYSAMNLSKRIDGLESDKVAMAAELAKSSQASQVEDGRLEDRVRKVEGRLSGIDERIGEVLEALEGFKREVKVAQAEADQKLAGLKDQLDLKESNLTQLVGQVRTDLDRTKQDADLHRKTYATQVGQVSDDFEYIKEELGKKAEKSYLRFLKRDLTKKMDGIAKDVVQVRTDLEEKISETEVMVTKKFEEFDTSVEAKVEKTVEKATAMDFVPTEEGE